MKRRLFKLALFLLLGAIVNVAVAWGCAYWIDPFNGRHEHARIMLDRFNWIRQVDKDGMQTLVYLPDGLDLEAKRLSWVDCYRQYGAHRLVRGPFFDQVQFSKTKHLGVLPAWADFDLGKHDHLGFSRGFEIIDGRGWPLVCLRSRFKIAGEFTYYSFTTKWSYIDSTSVIKSGYLLAGKKSTTLNAGWGMAEARRSLPINLVFGGFVFNTVFYAVVLAMVIYGPGTVRRIFWRRSGRCIKCGYNLHHVEHEKCPECGEELSAKAIS